MRREHVAALSLAVVREGKVVKNTGYGMANEELNVKANPDTVYNIASLGKQFTATAIMMLVQDGKMSLEDKIGDYLSYIPSAWTNITVRQLLTHTSGIKDYVRLPKFQELKTSPVITPQLVHLLAAYPLQFQPGEKWSYSNTGYHLLAEIIQKVSNQPLDVFLHRRIFAPLEMTSTRRFDWHSIILNRASPYCWRDGPLRNAEYLDYSWAFGAGAIASTTRDMAKWDASLYTEKILPRRRAEEIWTPVRLNDGTTFPYGFGWHVQTNGYTGRLVWHTGSDPGFLSAILRWMDYRITVIVLLTAGTQELPNGQDSSSDIALGVSRRFIPKLVSKPIPDSSPQTTAQMKIVLNSLVGGTLNTDLISQSLSGRKLSETKAWAAGLSDLGKIKSFSLIEKDEEDRRYDYRAVFASESLHFAVSFDNVGKIIELYLEIE